MRLKEVPVLFYLNFAVMIKNWIETLRVIQKFYKNFLFLKLDLSLRYNYFLNSPFKVSKTYLASIGANDLYTYGETPLTTLEKIIKEMNLDKNSLLLDLGSSTGRTSFWIHCFTGAKVIGIDHNPQFVAKARQLKEKFNLEHVNFLKDDIRNADYTNVNAIYMYGTCFDEVFIKTFIKNLESLPAGAMIATVSYPLTDYTENKEFEVIKELALPFSWGRASVYIQKKL